VLRPYHGELTLLSGKGEGGGDQTPAAPMDADPDSIPF